MGLGILQGQLSRFDEVGETDRGRIGMEAAGGVQFNLYLRRCDKQRVRDISVSTPVDVELSGIA
ncbi:MAG: hypothetical protein LBJ35_01410 [Spirochaetaceae bacterium]|nr:hypothetical protein [Spirochaetaceae bacterium]